MGLEGKTEVIFTKFFHDLFLVSCLCKGRLFSVVSKKKVVSLFWSLVFVYICFCCCKLAAKVRTPPKVKPILNSSAKLFPYFMFFGVKIVGPRILGVYSQTFMCFLMGFSDICFIGCCSISALAVSRISARMAYKLDTHL